ncbi:MAG: hypothetical protein HOC77_13470 [Chloroflexi bacterium]|nr:hypothetical protein [Chloroflexota bacterium]MBT4073023.1 hypothetical protein [Chloroflexota bacterium]MBT4516086.1 hypothetical protein [Chloroflexota bacterium]MBT5319076.1 hypothetical protein [Chloroflexota bacterium]MBT6682920.1 hypothetical protein [Chloroflexota bacterium]
MSNNRKERRRQHAVQRPWPISIVWAVVAVGIMLTFAVVVNSFIPNRAIHWDWVALMMVFGSAAGAWARRKGVI